MFILFVILLSASLAGLATHVYTTLTLQAQTVEYATQAFRYEQCAQGMLCYALAYVASQDTVPDELPCDIWNNATDGYIQGKIVCKATSHGYNIEVRVSVQMLWVKGLRAQVIREINSGKKVYTCVAIEPF